MIKTQDLAGALAGGWVLFGTVLGVGPRMGGKKGPHPVGPRPQGPAKPKRVKIQSGGVLLAIIHGYGRSGWRNSEARQTYLLKNAVGSEMKIRPVRVPARTADTRDSKEVSNGDVILDTFAGKPG